jgi:hypothetical protein
VHIEIFAAGCRAENESENKQDCGFISFLVPKACWYMEVVCQAHLKNYAATCVPYAGGTTQCTLVLTF